MKKKLIAGCLIVILVSSVITGVLAIGLIRQSLINSASDRLISNGYLINKVLINRQHEEINYKDFAKELQRETSQRITFIDSKGQLIADSMDNIEFHSINGNPELESSLKGNKTVLVNNGINGETYVSVVMPAVQVQNNVIIVRLQSPLDYLHKLTQILIRNIGFAIIIGIFTTISIGYAYSKRILKPINDITTVSKQIAKGNFKKRVVINTGDEIEDMGNTFNYMAETIESNINMLNYRNLKLRAITIGMVDGILAFDTSGNIILINELAKDILNLDEDTLEGANIYNLIHNDSILALIEATLKGEPHETKEMTFKFDPAFVYQVKTNLFSYEGTPENKGVVLVFEDITEIKKSESLKRDFIINASHELKTPLTTISGFLETLRLGNYKSEEQRERFMNIIESETNRLKTLTQNMLNLAVLENVHDYDEEGCTNLNINCIFKELKSVVEYLAESKNINLHFDIPEDFELKLCNKDWFKQLFLNLIHNAIKYTPTGGNVRVSCTIKQKEAIFIVEDDGVGISEEDLSRIFHRFYRVDKSRANEIDGTGLGLAIVKHIVKVLKGKITVESQVGKGSRFTVFLPVNKN
ncbi:HAMP domain-containing sensor histidine kinase [Clostridium sp. UBA4548]|uniref:HAMP domain-containing sensor histidine kinase n=1 Tax=Clostridium sp. UBA4548 TaxID=1946361 RepID=UPI0025BB146D|nr:HAMP domain-containing sensor histidine kinase [Clostridium sp. UBA4548]